MVEREFKMKAAIVLLGHGSQNPDSHAEFIQLCELVQRAEPEREVLYAYLQLRQPDLASVLTKLSEGRLAEVIIIPVFLFAGNHIQEDIPAVIGDLSKRFPAFTIKMGRHLGPDMAIAKLVNERINEVVYCDDYITDPEQIETTSFQIIEAALTGVKNIWTPAEREIVKRVIHTTADPDIAGVLDFHPGAIARGIDAIREGVRIITDVKMSLTGIGNKPTVRFGCSVECYIDNPEVAALAGRTGKTRAMSAMIKACTDMQRGIVVIGNAPTALFQLCEMIKTGNVKPDLIIGTPVGFVGATESKEVLKASGIPYIRTIGPRGGSPIAAAIVNALCKLAELQV
jgi:precorrin-8X/cobalt-precorrin-8 methylmutase